MGIDLPRGGGDAISHEDLRHDVPILAAGGEGIFLERLGQMHFSPTDPREGLVCAARGKGAVRTIVATWPSSVDEATAAAALISMAKAWDLAGGPTGRVELCIARPGFASHLHVGALASGPLLADGGYFRSGAPSSLTTVDRIDYSVLEGKVRSIFISFE